MKQNGLERIDECTLPWCSLILVGIQVHELSQWGGCDGKSFLQWFGVCGGGWKLCHVVAFEL